MKMKINDKDDIITIDGPVGAGKSTVAKIVAEKLHYAYLDTGAMYRALSLKVIKLGVNPNDTERVTELSRTTDISFDGSRVLLDGEDVSSLIRSKKVEEIVSLVSSIPDVRKNIVAIQRRIASKGRVVMEGRDCGTVVAPNARYKFYLDATVEERARRRLLDEKYLNQNLKLEDIVKSIQQRDQLDRTRQDSPLRIPEDAVVINTDGLKLEDVVSKILSVIQEKQLD